MTLPVGTRLGTYEIRALIGAGGMGEVYRAFDPRLGRDIAVKVLAGNFAENPGRLRRFKQEVRALAALNHPAVVQIHDAGEHGGRPFLVMELLEGETLRKRMARGPIPWRQAAAWAADIAEGLEAAHGRGLIHRDLKPENLFLTDHGIKILDFGLAKAPRQASRDASTLDAADAGSLEGVLVGTLGYMSPEQVLGISVDARSDLFSLGVVLCEMVSGSNPFTRKTSAETVAAILRDPFLPGGASPGDHPPGLDKLMARCLAKSPGDRFRNAQELVSELRTLLEARPSHRWRLPGWMWAVLAVILLGVTSLPGWRAQHAKPAPAPGARTPSVVVLPAKVIGEPRLAFLADAVPDTLSTLMGGLEGIDLRLPPTDAEVSKVQGNLDRILQAFPVDNLVTCTVRAQGEDFVLEVRITEAATRKVRWGSQFPGRLKAYDQVVRQAADALTDILLPGGKIDPVPARSNSDRELALQEGRYYLNRFESLARVEDWDSAVRALNRARRLDPGSAQVHATFALACIEKLWRDGDATKIAEGEAWARMALDRDPRCGEAWAALAQFQQARGRMDLPKAIEWAVKAVRFSPRGRFVNMNLGGTVPMISLGVASFRREIALHPLNLGGTGQLASFGLGAFLVWQERPEEAVAAADRALAAQPDMPLVLITKAFALTRLGRLPEARALLDLARPEPTARVNLREDWWNQVHFVLVAQDPDPAKARDLARSLMARYASKDADCGDVGNAAIVMTPDMVRLGMAEEALDLMVRSLEAGTPPPLDWLRTEPRFRPLRGNPKYLKLLEASRAIVTVAAGFLDQAKEAGELPDHLERPLAEMKAVLAIRP